jgi:hypothetical protein
MMKAVRTSETSVDNNFTRQYIPENNSEHQVLNKLGPGLFINDDMKFKYIFANYRSYAEPLSDGLEDH